MKTRGHSSHGGGLGGSAPAGLSQNSMKWRGRLSVAVRRSLVLVLLFAAGCPAVAARRGPVSRASVHGGLTLRVGVPEIPETLNPGLTQDLWTWKMTFPWVYQPLVRYDVGRRRFVGVLAASWEHERGKSAAKSRWTIHLKKGQKWHDGRSVTAFDVAFTLKLVAGKKARWLQASGLRDEFTSVDSVSVMDHLTVEVEAAPFFLQEAAGIPILPEHLLGRCRGMTGCLRAASRIVGSGPWKVVSLFPGHRLVLERLGRSVCRPLGAGRSPACGPVRVEYVAVPQGGRAVALLSAGRIHVLADSSWGLWADVASRAAATTKPPGAIRGVSLPVPGSTVLRVASRHGSVLARALAHLAPGWTDSNGPAGRSGDPARREGGGGSSLQDKGALLAAPVVEAGRILASIGWNMGVDGIRSKNAVSLVAVALYPEGAEKLAGAWKERIEVFRKAGVDLRILSVPWSWYRLMAVEDASRLFYGVKRLLNLTVPVAAVLLVFRSFEHAAVSSPYLWGYKMGFHPGRTSARGQTGSRKRARSEVKSPDEIRKGLWKAAGLFRLSGVRVRLLVGRRVIEVVPGGMWFDLNRVRLQPKR